MHRKSEVPGRNSGMGLNDVHQISNLMFSLVNMSLCHGKYVNIISLIGVICMYYMCPLPQNKAVNKIN